MFVKWVSLVDAGGGLDMEEGESSLERSLEGACIIKGLKCQAKHLIL